MSSSGGSISRYIGSAPAAVIAAVVVAAAAIVGPTVTGGSGSGSCTGANVTTGTFSSRLSSAAAGDTLCLSAGTYTWASKISSSPGITVEPVSGAAVTFNAMTLNGTTRATWVTFQGSTGANGQMSFKGLELCAPNNHVTWDHTLWDSGGQLSPRVHGVAAQITIRQDGAAGACGGSGSMLGENIVFDHSEFRNYEPNTGSGDDEPSVHFPGPDAAGAIGVTIQNSVFHNIDGDGIQDGVNGVQLIGNEFHDILDCGCGPHSDSIQMFGTTNTLVQGNWFHNTSDGIVQFDCCQTNDTISYNVFGPSEDRPIAIYDSTGEQILHNTTVAGTFGGIEMGANNGGSGTSGAVIRDNIIDGLNTGTGVTGTVQDHNLCRDAGCTGTGTITGSPTFTGGTSPSTRAGFALTTGSLGHLGASDGTDIGANP